ncbi:hypothetical protein AMTRI_Chr03g47100 [Amborella trichopoda]
MQHHQAAPRACTMNTSHLQQSYLHKAPVPRCLHHTYRLPGLGMPLALSHFASHPCAHKAACLAAGRPAFYLQTPSCTHPVHLAACTSSVLMEKGPDKPPPTKLRRPRRTLHPSLGPHKPNSEYGLHIAHFNRFTCLQALLVHLASTVCCYQAELVLKTPASHWVPIKRRFKATPQDTPPSHGSARSTAITKSSACLLSQIHCCHQVVSPLGQVHCCHQVLVYAPGQVLRCHQMQRFVTSSEAATTTHVASCNFRTSLQPAHRSSNVYDIHT